MAASFELLLTQTPQHVSISDSLKHFKSFFFGHQTILIALDTYISAGALQVLLLVR